ncbi:DUF1501 domain-containing protein [Fulvivirgaceae bacterium PWU4]|uniref:DUF1501 domain-containing protein n=1 Tax=Chryseosolibacter histidini TaxID=2782349 RepID=A0AAP2GPU8_9BACT|nr:DUF1501 domain-containing protein [Chryseosolibacter histidini]MBT1698320.1 DUF1501 domain-containing protein [Chryseosolibacter histidini]
MENFDKTNLLRNISRRHFLAESAMGLGAFAFGSMLGGCGGKETQGFNLASDPMAPRPPHFAGKAKRVIFLHMAGAPSQLELFDYKPELKKLNNQLCPPSLLEGKRFAFIRGVPKMLGPQAEFRQRGQAGAYVSDHLPHFAQVADEVSFLKGVYTDQFNHAPAQLFVHTGTSRLGRPSIGSWVTYGLGAENNNLPGFVVLTSGGKTPDAGKSIWGSGFLPSVYQGVQCRSEGDPVLYLSDPHGMDRDLKRKTIDAINDINREHYNEINDPETLTRIAQYEMAFRMQISVPEVMNINNEPDYIHQLYGTTPGKSSFANNCLLARKLVEQGVRFVQLFDWGWDSHGTDENLAIDIGFRNKCREIDRPMSALLLDLKQRGLLEETLVVWAGEFGRTPMQENRENKNNPFLGRDHHVEAFTIWMAGGGIKRGMSWGETDEIGYYPITGKVSVHDVQATILNQLGLDHEKLTYHFQGRPFRLTDVAGKVINEIVA